VNLKMNSRASVVNSLELKEKLNTPMNTIMSIYLFSEVPVITDNNSFALTALGETNRLYHWNIDRVNMGDTSHIIFKKKYLQRTANMVQKIFVQTLRAPFEPGTLGAMLLLRLNGRR